MNESSRRKKLRFPLWAVLFWLAVWQAASMAVGREIFLPSPWRVLTRLAELAVTAPFWLAMGYTSGSCWPR